MKLALPLIVHAATNANTHRRRAGFIAMAVLGCFTLCGFTAPVACKETSPPSHTGAEVAGVTILAGAAVGSVVLVEMHHNRHTIEGCVSASQSGLQLENMKDGKVYTLLGATASTRAGDVVRLHGDKEKRKSGDKQPDSPDATFVVQRVARDFGPCKPAPTVSSSSNGVGRESQDAD